MPVACKFSARAMVLIAVLIPALPVRAELSCDQLVATAQAGIALRDQGSTLRQVLAEADKAELRERFKPEELAVMRRALQLTYTGEVSMHELATSCAESKGNSKPR